MSLGVVIHGGGVAARCLEALLGRRKLAVRRLDSGRARVPAILLGPAAQSLLVEIFGTPALWAGCWPIQHRVVLWGGRSAVKLPHSAIVLSEEQLLGLLEAARPVMAEAALAEADWTIETASPPAGSDLVRFGDRKAEAVEAEMTPSADAHACLMEATDRGWLFLLPYRKGRAWLLAAGASVDDLLAESQLARTWIGEVGEPRGAFPASPRLMDPLCGPGWMACGSAAMGFDPLCGDGTGHAAREAILAAAVVEASTRESPTLLLEEFQLRLQGGMARHLVQCEEFYRSGSNSPWWAHQAEEARRGLDRLKGFTRGVMGRFVLEGFALRRSPGYGTLTKP